MSNINFRSNLTPVSVRTTSPDAEAAPVRSESGNFDFLSEKEKKKFCFCSLLIIQVGSWSGIRG